jgi:hypothetical protein
VPRGEVQGGGRERTCKGVRLKAFQHSLATVRNVLGEFYWKVEVGEQVDAYDFVSPPYILTIETTGDMQDSQEVNCSFGTYVPAEEVQQAFKLPALTKGFGVAPNQPSPVDNTVFWTWPLIIGFIVVLYGFFRLIRPSGTVDSTWLWMSLVLVSLYPLGTWLYKRDFEKRRWADSDFNPYAAADSD